MQLFGVRRRSDLLDVQRCVDLLGRAGLTREGRGLGRRGVDNGDGIAGSRRERNRSRRNASADGQRAAGDRGLVELNGELSRGRADNLRPYDVGSAVYKNDLFCARSVGEAVGYRTVCREFDCRAGSNCLFGRVVYLSVVVNGGCACSACSACSPRSARSARCTSNARCTCSTVYICTTLVLLK